MKMSTLKRPVFFQVYPSFSPTTPSFSCVLLIFLLCVISATESEYLGKQRLQSGFIFSKNINESLKKRKTTPKGEGGITPPLLPPSPVVVQQVRAATFQHFAYYGKSS